MDKYYYEIKYCGNISTDLVESKKLSVGYLYGYKDENGIKKCFTVERETTYKKYITYESIYDYECFAYDGTKKYSTCTEIKTFVDANNHFYYFYLLDESYTRNPLIGCWYKINNEAYQYKGLPGEESINYGLIDVENVIIEKSLSSPNDLNALYTFYRCDKSEVKINVLFCEKEKPIVDYNYAYRVLDNTNNENYSWKIKSVEDYDSLIHKNLIVDPTVYTNNCKECDSVFDIFKITNCKTGESDFMQWKNSGEFTEKEFVSNNFSQSGANANIFFDNVDKKFAFDFDDDNCYIVRKQISEKNCETISSKDVYTACDKNIIKIFDTCAECNSTCYGIKICESDIEYYPENYIELKPYIKKSIKFKLNNEEELCGTIFEYKNFAHKRSGTVTVLKCFSTCEVCRNSIDNDMKTEETDSIYRREVYPKEQVKDCGGCEDEYKCGCNK